MRLRVALCLCLAVCFSGSACSGSKSSACTLESFLSGPQSGKDVAIGHTTYGGTSVAQQFLSEGGTAYTAQAYLARVGTFTANTQTVTATLETSASGKPSGTALGTSNPIDVANIPTTAGLQKFTFISPVILTAGTAYWLRIKASYAVNSTNYVSWSGYDGLSGGYNDQPTYNWNALYEDGSGTFLNNLISAYRYLLFTIDC